MADLALTQPASRAAEDDFRVGRVIHRAAFALSRNVAMNAMLALAVAVPSVFLEKLRSYPVLSWLVVLAVVVATPLAQAAITYGTVASMRGQPADFRRLFGFTARRSLPIVGVYIVYNVAAVLGLIALIVPGAIAMTAWLVAIPACLVEQTGPIASLRRSAQLTKGLRWKLFGVLLIVVIIQVAGTMPGFFHTTPGLIAASISSAVAFAAASVLVAVIYHDLRVAKEGIDTGRIASVFE